MQNLNEFMRLAGFRILNENCFLRKNSEKSLLQYEYRWKEALHTKPTLIENDNYSLQDYEFFS